MKKLALLCAAMIGMSGIANAISISINVGDQPYYTRGPAYWYFGVHYCFIPGHWEKHHHKLFWVHGSYVPC